MMNSCDLARFHGASVLVRCAQDDRDPPIALRGSLNTLYSDGYRRIAAIVLDFPQMCLTSAHRRVLPLDRTRLDQLLASEHAGTFEYVLEGPLDLVEPPVGEQPAQSGHPPLYTD